MITSIIAVVACWCRSRSKANSKVSNLRSYIQLRDHVDTALNAQRNMLQKPSQPPIPKVEETTWLDVESAPPSTSYQTQDMIVEDLPTEAPDSTPPLTGDTQTPKPSRVRFAVELETVVEDQSTTRQKLELLSRESRPETVNAVGTQLASPASMNTQEQQEESKIQKN